ncbi:hypothetical protein VNI00_017726 [Paramarasmius palmivorus]|uniref:Transcription factor n=1 Tax=Paramarasmius palmivorus TaxID=297713 RepID=A0AAW0B5K4_9AGAR
MSSQNDTASQELAEALHTAIKLAHKQLDTASAIAPSTRQLLVDLHCSLTSVILGSFDSSSSQNLHQDPAPLISNDELERLWCEGYPFAMEGAEKSAASFDGSPSIESSKEEKQNPCHPVIPPNFSHDSVEYATWFYNGIVPVKDLDLHYDYSTELTLLQDSM